MDTLPYHQIPNYPSTYTAATVSARMLDGLGYRYFWATEGLTDNELSYRLGENSRTIEETLQHIHGLSKTCLNAAKNEPNIRGSNQEEYSWLQLRRKTLENIKDAADLLRSNVSADLEKHKIIFQRGDKKSEFPFWNLLNGPLADALWHTGQVVSLRRAAGNPIPSGVNVFMGKTRAR